MKNLCSLFISLVGLLFVLQIGFVSAAAQDYNREYERQRLAAVMNPNANPEEFRAEMMNYLTELENALQRFEKFPVVARQFDKDGLDPIADLQKAKADLAEISVEDLVKMRSVYAKSSSWREAPRAIGAIIEKLEQNSKSDKNSGGITPNVIIVDACPDLSATPSFADIAVAEGFWIAADAVMEGFPSDFISILARIAPIAARAALRATLTGLNTTRSQYDDCNALDSTDVTGIVNTAKTEIINNDDANTTTIVSNDNSNKTAILNSVSSSTTSINNNVTNSKNEIINNDNNNKTMITTAITDAKNTIINNDNSNTTTIVNNDNANALTLNTNLTNAKNAIIANDNTNTTNIVNNDNSNRTQIINNANANTTTLINNGNANTTALSDLIMRSLIEADLATESNGVKVAWYMTPTANGGKLDLVQQIVTQTLANILAGAEASATRSRF